MEPRLTPIQAAQEDQAFQYLLAQCFGGCRHFMDDAEGNIIIAYLWRGAIYVKYVGPPPEPTT